MCLLRTKNHICFCVFSSGMCFVVQETSALLKRMGGLKAADAREQATRRAAQQRLAQDFQTWMSKFQEVATLDLSKERRDAQQQQVVVASPQKGSGAAFPGLGKVGS